MNTIFSRIKDLHAEAQDLVLVTIIDEEGSSPRGTGSQMLVGPNGQICGTIGGGAVEKRSEEYAMQLLGEKKSATRKFELRSGVEQDIGMECGGDVTAFFQFVNHEDAEWAELAQALVDRIDAKEKGWLVLNLDGALPVLVNADKGIAYPAEAEAPDCALGDGAKLSNNLFSMPLPVGERVILCGGGHVAKALAPVLHSVGFRILVMDDRAEFVTEERFPMAEKRLSGDFSKLNEVFELSSDDYVVIMTNGHRHDFEAEEQALRCETAYVGVIGSASKTASVNERLRAAGVSEEKISSVHTPIGLNIKAATPEEIAISITAEMVLVRAEHRERFGKLSNSCPMR